MENQFNRWLLLKPQNHFFTSPISNYNKSSLFKGAAFYCSKLTLSTCEFRTTIIMIQALLIGFPARAKFCMPIPKPAGKFAGIGFGFFSPGTGFAFV
jgi:hypothetical protein